MQMIAALSTAFLLAFVGLFPIINPLESAPLFLALTRSCSAADRSVLAWQVTINSFFLLLGSMLLGPWILQFCGIDLSIMRITGGLVVVFVGWKVFSKSESQSPEHAAVAVAVAVTEAKAGPIRSFYPLTMPLTIGPGSMSIAIAIGSRGSGGTNNPPQWILHLAGAFLGLVAIGASIYLCYRYATHIVRILGETGADVFVRLSAFIMMCIGMQFIWDGFSTLMNTVPH